jgi:hypothetical protein
MLIKVLPSIEGILHWRRDSLNSSSRSNNPDPSKVNLHYPLRLI